MYFLLFTIFFCVFSVFANEISIYGDVYQNKVFFNRTLPWIVDNIGGEIKINFHMVGSGRYSIPQMCVLETIPNTYIQAQYLKCEAEGNLSEYCLCQTGIDPETFKYCVAHGGHLASRAAYQFNQVGVEVTPLVELGYKSTVFGVGDYWFLKKICTIFGDNLPRGCIKPFACNQTNTDEFNERRAIAHFDKDCHKEWSDFFQPNQYTTTSTTTSVDVYDKIGEI